MQSFSVVGNRQPGDQVAIDLGSGTSRSSLLPDWLGILASVGCAIHCAAMPFVITFLPMFGLSFLADAFFHKAMVGVCLLLALLAFVPGWRVHRRWLPAGLAMAGLTTIATAAFVLEDSCACCAPPQEATTVAEAQPSETQLSVCTNENCEHCAQANAADDVTEEISALLPAGFTPWITPLGGLFLVSAHLVNHRFTCRYDCCPPKVDAA